MIISRPHEVDERTRAIRNDFLQRYNADQLREQLYLEQEGICAICKKQMQDSHSIICVIDHAIPVNVIANWDWDVEKAIAVANARQNLLAVHAGCNSRKHSQDYEELMEQVVRGEIVFGDTALLTAEQIQARIADQKKLARKAGLRAVESGQFARMLELPQTKEARSRNGHAQGRKNTENGHMDRMRSKLTSEILSEAGRIGSRKNVGIGGLDHIRTKESESKGGRIAGRRNVESGHLARISQLSQTKEASRKRGREAFDKGLGLFAPEHKGKGGLVSGHKALQNKTGIHADDYDKSKGGRIGGRKNVESGHIAALGRAQGRKMVDSGHLARIRELPQTKAAMSRNGVSINHSRWHVKRNIINSKCELCTTANAT